MSKQLQTSFSPGLYIVATPIGNAADITLRALALFEAADVIACEDTRVTGKLLTIHGLKASLTPYHEHNAERVRPQLIKRLKNGETVALVSDAGTPLISDPGYKLVQACRDTDILVQALPGASSVLAALVSAGLPTDRFFFAGFLPSKKAARRQELESLAAVPGTLIVMESSRRLPGSLQDIADVLGDRDAAIARELTKLHEELRRGTLSSLAQHYQDAGAPKGEVVIVIAPPGDQPSLSQDQLDALINEALNSSSLRDAVKHVTETTGLPRRIVYARALELNETDE